MLVVASRPWDIAIKLCILCRIIRDSVFVRLFIVFMSMAFHSPALSVSLSLLGAADVEHGD